MRKIVKISPVFRIIFPKSDFCRAALLPHMLPKHNTCNAKKTTRLTPPPSGVCSHFPRRNALRLQPPGLHSPLFIHQQRVVNLSQYRRSKIATSVTA
jgi:hypothetical protein